MSNRATTVSPDREEITVDTGVADIKKSVQRQNGDDNKPSNWLDRDRQFKRRMASVGDKIRQDVTRQFDQRRAEDDARWQRELAQRDEEIDRLKRDQTSSTSDAEHQAKIDKLLEELEAAIEAGQSKEQARINVEISRLEAAHIQAKTEARLGRSNADKRTEKKGAETVNDRPPAKKAVAFTRALSWWDNPKYIAEQGAANAIHQALIDEGSDPESDDHYKKLGKRLKKKFPKLKLPDPDRDELDDDDELEDDEDRDTDRDDDDNDDEGEDADEEEETSQRRRAPVMNFRDRGNPGGPSRRRSVKLDASDIQTMKDMKLDPTNDQHVQQFAIAKGERLAQEA